MTSRRQAPQEPDLRLYLGYGLTVLALAAHFALFKSLRTSAYLDLDLYAAGAERLPYQLRALAAWVGAALRDALSLLPVHRLPQPFHQPSAVAFLIIDAVSMVVAITVTRATLAQLTGSRRFALVASMSLPLMGLFNYLLLANKWALSYPYDLPQLAFFCLALHAIVLRRRAWLALWFLLGCLNRDTAIFIAMIWILYELGPRFPGWTQMRRRPLDVARSVLDPVGANLAFMLALAGIWIASRMILFHVYRDNPVEAGEFAAGGLFSTQHALRNLRDLANPLYWPSFASNFAFLWVALVVGWRHLTVEGLRWSLLVLPPWIVLMTAVGVLTEMRVFGELIALLALCVGVVWWNWMQEALGVDVSTTAARDQ